MIANKSFIMKIIINLVFILLPFLLTAQNVKDTVKIVGFYKKSTEYYGAPKKIKLDDAQLSVTYQFKHALKRGNETFFVEDTMVLVVGPRFSIYFDRNDENRRKAFSSYFRNKGAPEVFMSTPFKEFTEIAINDDYLFSPTISGETSQLYKDRKNNIITVMDFDNSNFNVDELFFLYEEEIQPIGWTITEDTTSVLGYLCTKATCSFGGRDYTAWFTQEIPINEGPYKFYGLPGMILKIEDSEKLYQFHAIGLEKLKNTEIMIDDNSNHLKCSKEEYNTLKKRMTENYTVFYRAGIVLHFSYKKSGVEYMPIEKIE